MILDDVLKKHGIVPAISGGVGPGWAPLVDDLIVELVAAGWDKKLGQVKEKLGGLRFYLDTYREEWEVIVTKYEHRSIDTCETCGKPGKREEVIILSWEHQCFCGSVEAKWYRAAWWCFSCGRERLALHFFGCSASECRVCIELRGSRIR